jgi:hypothetical protein
MSVHGISGETWARVWDGSGVSSQHQRTLDSHDGQQTTTATIATTTTTRSTGTHRGLQ